MGSGAAPGVPAIANGWGACNPNNPKNRRRRTGTYIEIGNTKILIDTSPDLHSQLLDNNIRQLDAVLYTHAHADHLHGIDDLRDINRITLKSLDIYANRHTLDTIEVRFKYLITDKDHPNNPLFRPSLIANLVEPGKEFLVGDVQIMPIPLAGHAIESNGYMFNGGELVYISDCKEITAEGLSLIKKRPKLLVMPLTSPKTITYHMGLDRVLEYINLIKPHKTIINHMAVECDYDQINELTPDDVLPAYDNMLVEF